MSKYQTPRPLVFMILAINAFTMWYIVLAERPMATRITGLVFVIMTTLVYTLIEWTMQKKREEI
ncbi:MAG: hypothetical protein JSV76_05810 [Candidatus Bathyarchaeota archaeon]|nr:MAG: hypothetical protein JSV76_05810 [Candidatus Bathyarchaeota archaeon]